MKRCAKKGGNMEDQKVDMASIRRYIALFLVLVMIAVPVTAAASPKISKKKVTVTVGKTVQLKVAGTKKKPKWSSNKKSVATVNSKGRVTAKKVGKATITAKIGSKKYRCVVTVKAAKTVKAESGYKAIYDKYAALLRKHGPDYSISEMADLCYEGIEKMAEYFVRAKGKDGQYATYEKWATKLMDVYLAECR
jgi:hypothetical protein